MELAKVQRSVTKMVANISQANEGEKNIAMVEKRIMAGVVDIGKMLLQNYIHQSQISVMDEGRPTAGSGVVMESKGSQERRYMSLFGELAVERQKYYSQTDKTYYPLDVQMNLPQTKYSFALQNLIGSKACEEGFEQSMETINELLGHNLDGMQAQRISNCLGSQVDAYYGEGSKIKEREGSHLVIGADGKGVRIIKSERGVKSDKKQKQERARLMKGEKRGVKKIATVTTTFSFNPIKRSPKEMIKSLHKEWSEAEKKQRRQELEQLGERPRRPINQHKRAFLESQDQSLDYAVQILKKRDPGLSKPIIALVDGGSGLEPAIKTSIEKAQMSHRLDAIILDIIHVSEYVWKAANAILGEKSPHREAWVRKRLLQILNSQTDVVLKELKQILKQATTTTTMEKALTKVITYFTNHKHKMDYKTYLAKGYPIATSIVEGCCGHLVKDRMEGSGMRWGLKGAQNILNLRSIKKNGDWENFMTYVQNQNYLNISKENV